MFRITNKQVYVVKDDVYICEANRTAAAEQRRQARKARASNPQDDVPLIPCPNCQRTFCARIGLVSHLRTHQIQPDYPQMTRVVLVDSTDEHDILVSSDMSLPGSSWALLALTVLLCAAVSGQVFPAPAHLYPYGPGAGDTTAPAIDDGSSGKVPVSPPFPVIM